MIALAVFLGIAFMFAIAACKTASKADEQSERFYRALTASKATDATTDDSEQPI